MEEDIGKLKQESNPRFPTQDVFYSVQKSTYIYIRSRNHPTALSQEITTLSLLALLIRESASAARSVFSPILLWEFVEEFLTQLIPDFFPNNVSITLASTNSKEPPEISVYDITFSIFLFSSHTLYLNHCPDTGDNESRFEIIMQLHKPALTARREWTQWKL